MTKTRTSKPHAPALRPPDPARQTLRALKHVCETTSPVALAAHVTEVENTLASVALIEAWFKRYAAALKQRRVQ